MANAENVLIYGYNVFFYHKTRIYDRHKNSLKYERGHGSCDVNQTVKKKAKLKVGRGLNAKI